MNTLVLFLIYIIIFVYGSTNIINGEPAPLSHFSYQAKLLSIKKYFLCGGTIINNHWILTAAHCCNNNENSPVYVEVGNYLLYPVGDEGIYSVNKTIRHDKYDARTLLNNIALLYIKSEIKFNNYIGSINLPANNINKYHNIWVIGSGWGYQKNENSQNKYYSLQYVVVRTISNRKCQKLLRNVVVNSKIICTFSRSRTSGHYINSGGPIVSEKTLIGVLSLAMIPKNTYSSVINVNTRVSSYLKWINDTVQSHSD